MFLVLFSKDRNQIFPYLVKLNMMFYPIDFTDEFP